MPDIPGRWEQNVALPGGEIERKNRGALATSRFCLFLQTERPGITLGS
jgi:agmatine/peptidylarginine deiminase